MLKQFLIKHNILKGKFLIESFVYVNEKTGLPVESSNTIKWLTPFFIECKIKEKDKRSFEMLHYKYPEYSGYINLY